MKFASCERVSVRKMKIDPWQKYRTRRLVFWLFVFFGLACIVVLPQQALLYINRDQVRMNKNVVFLVSVSIFLPILFFLSHRLGHCKCPNCGKPFHFNPLYLYGNLLSSSCVNCHTPVGGPSADSGPATESGKMN